MAEKVVGLTTAEIVGKTTQEIFLRQIKPGK